MSIQSRKVSPVSSAFRNTISVERSPQQYVRIESNNKFAPDIHSDSYKQAARLNLQRRQTYNPRAIAFKSDYSQVGPQYLGYQNSANSRAKQITEAIRASMKNNYVVNTKRGTP